MKPKLRVLDLQPYGDQFLLRDPLRLSPDLLISYPAALLMSLMDGTRDEDEIRSAFFRATGYWLSQLEIRSFIESLDHSLLLENENYHKALEQEKLKIIQRGIRTMSHVGEVYPAEKEECTRFLLMGEREPDGEMLGIMVPHMDLRVARNTYWEGYRRTPEDKSLVIILGVSHYWHEMPFSVLPLDIETPFGLLQTRRDLLERLQSLFNFDLTHDLLSYRMEHSIEFASVYAKLLFPEASALALIVSYGEPKLLKRLGDSLLSLIDKELYHSILISSVDMSHVGKKFGDRSSYDPAQKDRTYLDLLLSLQNEEAFEFINTERNPTRIDGVYTNLVFGHMLRSAGIRKGKLFDYKQYYEKPTDSIVSYASAGF